MSLNWSIEKVKDWKKKQRKQRNRAVLNAIIWSTLVIGFNSITEKNYKKFYARLTAMEHLNGAYLYKGDKPAYITLEEVQMWIGLWTNGDNTSASDFEKRLTRD